MANAGLGHIDDFGKAVLVVVNILDNDTRGSGEGFCLLCRCFGSINKKDAVER